MAKAGLFRHANRTLKKPPPLTELNAKVKVISLVRTNQIIHPKNKPIMSSHILIFHMGKCFRITCRTCGDMVRYKATETPVPRTGLKSPEIQNPETLK